MHVPDCAIACSMYQRCTEYEVQSCLNRPQPQGLQQDPTSTLHKLALRHWLRMEQKGAGVLCFIRVSRWRVAFLMVRNRIDSHEMYVRLRCVFVSVSLCVYIYVCVRVLSMGWLGWFFFFGVGVCLQLHVTGLFSISRSRSRSNCYPTQCGGTTDDHLSAKRQEISLCQIVLTLHFTFFSKSLAPRLIIC